jgi:hypothetical protein
MHKTHPQAQILQNMGTARRPCPTARTGAWPPEHDLSAPPWPGPATWLPDCRQELAAVSRADQSWIIASIVSRRPEEMWSYLACGTGMHLIHRGARIYHENVAKEADVLVEAPSRGLGDLDAAASAGRRRVPAHAGPERRPRGSRLARKGVPGVPGSLPAQQPPPYGARTRIPVPPANTFPQAIPDCGRP